MYPVHYEADYLRERNRLTTFFRLIVAIPWLIISYVYGLVQMVVVAIAWFAILILGRFPEGMYDLVGGILRFNMRVSGWVNLQTDEWPSFGISDEPNYPIRVNFKQPAARQSRLKTLFRLILLIPLMVLSYAMAIALTGVTIVSWLTIVFRGYQPAGIHNAISYLMGWTTRTNAYSFLMRDEYPPVGDENPVDVDPSEQDLIEATSGASIGYPAAQAAPLPPAEGSPPPPVQ